MRAHTVRTLSFILLLILSVCHLPQQALSVESDAAEQVLVFGVGMKKTGTSTLSAVFSLLGLRQLTEPQVWCSPSRVTAPRPLCSLVGGFVWLCVYVCVYVCVCAVVHVYV
jgi:hypothetical protein